MDKLAFIIGNTFIYWNSLLLIASVAAGACLFGALYLSTGGRGLTAAVFVPLAMLLSVFLARAIHWYCLPNQYAGLDAALTNLSGGGYALTGAVLGCLLAALLLRWIRMETDLLRMLDCISIALCGTVALGRLSYFYSATDKGMIVSAQKLPIAFPVINAISGAAEYRFPTFLFQAILLGLLFVGLMVLFLRERRLPNLPHGDITLVFVLFYSALGVVMDSTRYDSLYLRSNGFVSMVQILCALGLLGVILYYSLRMVRLSGVKRWYITMWVLLGVLFGGAGFMEYYVQRHGRQALFAYSLMSVCLVEMLVIIMILRTQYHRCLAMHSKAVYPFQPLSRD